MVGTRAQPAYEAKRGAAVRLWLYSSLFWLALGPLMLFYPFTGLHHFLQAPVPTWLNELAVTFSILLIIPVLAVTTNFLFTPGANWRRLFDSYPLRFALLGAIYYLATCIQGPIQASNTLNWYIHFTEWTAAHAHLALAVVALYHAFSRLGVPSVGAVALLLVGLYLALTALVGHDPLYRLLDWDTRLPEHRGRR